MTRRLPASLPGTLFSLTLTEQEAHMEAFGQRLIAVKRSRFDEEWLKVRYTSERGTGLLSPAVRYLNANHTRVIFERPPVVVPLWYYPGFASRSSAKKAQCYRIPLPWQLYCIEFDSQSYRAATSFRVFARPEPVSSRDDQVYGLPLPNMEALTGQCCLGADAQNAFAHLSVGPVGLGGVSADPPGLGPTIDRLLNIFWMSHFNDDMPGWNQTSRLPANMGAYGHVGGLTAGGNPTGAAFLRAWAEHTLPEVLAWPWVPSNWLGPDTTVGMIMDHFEKRPLAPGISSPVLRDLYLTHHQACMNHTTENPVDPNDDPEDDPENDE